MNTSLSAEVTSEISNRLQQANNAFSQRYPGETGRRQPVHTVYGGAHLFKSDSATRLGSLARRSLDQFGPDFITFAHALQLPGSTRLPEITSEGAELLSELTTDPERLRSDNKPAWLAHTIYDRVREKLRREPVEDFRIDFEDGYGNRPDTEEDGHAEAAAVQVVEGMKNQTLPPFIGIRIKPFNE